MFEIVLILIHTFELNCVFFYTSSVTKRQDLNNRPLLNKLPEHT